MRCNTTTWILAACCVCLAFVLVGPARAAGLFDDDGFAPGLAGHYYRDVSFWGGLWPDDLSKPVADADSWTYGNYSYTRIEPLMNHLFIRCGWFSVRWKGYLDTAVAGKQDVEADYTFTVFADDGCRLTIDGETVISDWMARSEGAAGATRKATVKLAPGKHTILVEYFQGQSLSEDDHDPMKVYWACPARGIGKQVVPAANYFFTEADLQADAGRLD